MAAGNVAQGGARQRNIAFHFSFTQRNFYQIAIQPSKSQVTKKSLDLWAQAYELVIQREGDLMAKYKKQLNSFINGRPPTNADLLDPNYVLFIVKQLLESWEQKKKKNEPTTPDKMGDMQPHVDRLTELLVWSEAIVTPVVSTQPHKTLAWFSIPLFLSVGYRAQSPIATDDGRNAHIDQLLQRKTPCNEAILQGFNSLADMHMFWIFFEKVYPDLQKVPQHKKLKAPLISLYSFIIEYQVRATCHLSKSRLPWAAKPSKNSDQWLRMMKSIKMLNKGCRSLISPQQKALIRRKRDDWKKKMQKLKKRDEITLPHQK